MEIAYTPNVRVSCLRLGCLVLFQVYVIGPIIGAILAAILYEFFLSAGACLERTKAFFSKNFDRNRDYRKTDGDEDTSGR